MPDGWCAPALAEAPVEKRCQTSSLYRADQLQELAGCTTLVGMIQEDSVTELTDFTGLESVRRIEGRLNIFRSPGFTSLRGLDNLEVVDGNLSIHMNPNLRSIDSLRRLHTVTGQLFVDNNDTLPQAQVDDLVACVAVGAP
ncbi:MAG: hypothetical protein ACKV2T_35840 [Kofleriaceae bacterium]